MDTSDKQYILNRMQKIINLFKYLNKEAQNINNENEVIIARPFTYILYSHLLPDFYQTFDKEEVLKNVLYIKRSEPRVGSTKEKNEAVNNSFLRKNRELVNNVEDFFSVYFGFFRPFLNGKYDLDWLFKYAGSFFYGTNLHVGKEQFLIRPALKYKGYDSDEINSSLSVSSVFDNMLVLFSNRDPNKIEREYAKAHGDDHDDTRPVPFNKLLAYHNQKFEKSMFSLGLKAGKLENYRYTITAHVLIHLLCRLKWRVALQYGVKFKDTPAGTFSRESEWGGKLNA